MTEFYDDALFGDYVRLVSQEPDLEMEIWDQEVYWEVVWGLLPMTTEGIRTRHREKLGSNVVPTKASDHGKLQS